MTSGPRASASLSQRANVAAAVRSPGCAQPYASVRICAPIHSRNGLPTTAARLALVDARLSHTGAGVDGALWVATMSAAAMVLDSPSEVGLAGLDVIAADGAIARAAMGWAAPPVRMDCVTC